MMHRRRHYYRWPRQTQYPQCESTRCPPHHLRLQNNYMPLVLCPVCCKRCAAMESVVPLSWTLSKLLLWIVDVVALLTKKIHILGTLTDCTGRHVGGFCENQTEEFNTKWLF